MRAREFLKRLIKLGVVDDSSPQRLDEGGKPVQLDKRTTARTDHPTHGGDAQTHTHLNTKGKPERIINKDGTASHGTGPFTLTDKEVEYLKKKGHTIPANRLVESLGEEARKSLDGYRLLKG